MTKTQQALQATQAAISHLQSMYAPFRSQLDGSESVEVVLNYREWLSKIHDIERLISPLEVLD